MAGNEPVDCVITIGDYRPILVDGPHAIIISVVCINDGCDLVAAVGQGRGNTCPLVFGDAAVEVVVSVKRQIPVVVNQAGQQGIAIPLITSGDDAIATGLRSIGNRYSVPHAEDIRADIDAVPFSRGCHDSVSLYHSAQTVVRIEGDVTGAVHRVDCQRTGREDASRDRSAGRAVRIRPRYQVVARVVAVFACVAEIVHITLQAVKAIVEERRQKYFVRNTRNLANIRLAELDDVVVIVIADLDDVPFGIHGLNQAVGTIVKESGRVLIIFHEKSSSRIPVVFVTHGDFAVALRERAVGHVRWTHSCQTQRDKEPTVSLKQSSQFVIAEFCNDKVHVV